MQKIFFPSSKPRFINEQEIIGELKDIALNLAKKNKNIETVYLFGSFAKGSAGIHSDADVLVVVSDEHRRMIDRQDEFILEFLEAPVPVDVLVKTRKELSSALAEDNRFFVEAVKGIRLV